MNLMNKIFLPILVLGLSTAYLQADNETDNHNITLAVPQIALLDIESASAIDISVTLVAPDEAGDPMASQTDNSLWLNVTSIVNSGNTRNISVKIDKVVLGLDVKVVAATYSGLGNGNWGTPNPEFALTTTDQTLVNGITSGYTGDGAENGYQLTYTVDPDETAFDALEASSPSLVVTYTLAP